VPVDTEDLLVDALAQLGVQARQAAGVGDDGIDVVIEPGGTHVQVKRRALVTDDVARHLLAGTPPPSGAVLLLVGDRVTEAARRLLVEHRAGYYDLRGHDDPGDRLHASAHAWASDSATGLTIEVVPLSGARVEVSALVAEPGPLIAMKLQAIMNRAVTKQGTDLQDIVRLILDQEARPAALAQ
jgi:hypothetical protein